jgi:hypothetical protein
MLQVEVILNLLVKLVCGKVLLIVVPARVEALMYGSHAGLFLSLITYAIFVNSCLIDASSIDLASSPLIVTRNGSVSALFYFMIANSCLPPMHGYT